MIYFELVNNVKQTKETFYYPSALHDALTKKFIKGELNPVGHVLYIKKLICLPELLARLKEEGSTPVKKKEEANANTSAIV